MLTMKLFHILSLLLMGGLLFCQVHADDFSDVEEEYDSDDGIAEEIVPAPVIEKPTYGRPIPSGPTHFHEPFHTRAEYLKRWVASQAKKDEADAGVAKYDGKWEVEEPAENPILKDLALVLKSKAKHHAISAKLNRPFEFSGKPFIAQYEVRFQNGMDCGGAYIKFLSKSDKLNQKNFTDKTPYTIMFGPDKCGNDHKLHFIFRHKNPVTGEYEEKHAEKPSAKLDSFFNDRKIHLYTLIVRPDNTYEVKVDNGLVSSGNLLENFSPPVNPPKEIEDANDMKPSDWDDREKITDTEAKKPTDWDETEPATIVDEDAMMPEGWLEDEEVYVPDPSATKPEDWDEEMDGEWEAPRIDNPKCKDSPGCGKWELPTNPKHKGIWKAPMIDNPAYKGEWKPQVVTNPNFFDDQEPYKMTPIGAVGLELWSMTSDIVFDNFIITDNETVVEDFTADTWEVKSNSERAAASTGGWWYTIKKSADERPWLWGIYIMVILIPVVLLSICLCPRSGPVKPEDIQAHKKKFDDPSPDVIEEEEEEEAQKDEEQAQKEEEEAQKEEEEAQEEGVKAQQEAEGKDKVKDDVAEYGAGGKGDFSSSVMDEKIETGAAGDRRTPDVDEGVEEAEEAEDTSESSPKGSSKKSGSPRRRMNRKE